MIAALKKYFLEHKLSRKSWHAKLIYWCYGLSPHQFTWQCNYHWLLTFTLLLLPFVALFAASVKGVGSLNDYLENRRSLRRAACYQKEEEEVARIISQFESDMRAGIDSDIVLTFKRWQAGEVKRLPNNAYKRAWDQSVWLSKDEEFVSHLWKSFDAYEQVADLEKERKEQEDKAHMQQVQKVTRGVAKIALVIVSAVVGYYTFKLVMWLISLCWMSILVTIFDVLLLLTVIVVVGASLYGTVALFIILVRWAWCVLGRYCVPCARRRESIGNAVLTVLGVLIFPFAALWSLLSTMWDIVKEWKKDNCPAIEWED